MIQSGQIFHFLIVDGRKECDVSSTNSAHFDSVARPCPTKVIKH